VQNKIDEVEIVVFDTETTGLNPSCGDRIIEIAGVRLKGYNRIGEFQSLVNPGRKVSSDAFAVNGISDEMLKGAPDIREVMPRFLSFIKGSFYLCSYNAPFDMGFINNELKLLGRNELNDIIAVDILRIARRLLPGLERYALWFVAEKLGIQKEQKHRALSDVELTLQVFHRFKESLKVKDMDKLSDISSLFGLNSRLLNDIRGQKIARIQEAMDLGAKIKIKYLSRSATEASERQVLPKEIRRENGEDYLVGFCCLRNEERTFRIDNILGLEVV